MDLESTDLNLLLAFDVLFAEGSVTQAARKLHMSQPAMSGALARLRLQFGDPLFVRAAGRMRPTPRARQLARPIARAIATLREAIETEVRFRPEESTRQFLISATDYVEALLLGPLLTALRPGAPGVSIRTVRPPQVFLPPEDSLRAGEVDLALGLFPGAHRPKREFLAKPLFRDRLVAVVRAHHPGVGRTLSLKTMLRLPQIRIVYLGDVRTGLLDSILAGLGHERNAALTVASMAAVPEIVAHSDLLGFAPERLARQWVRGRTIRLLELPIPMPDLPLTMVWHESHHRDPMQAWFREVITAEFSNESLPRTRRAPAGGRSTNSGPVPRSKRR